MKEFKKTNTITYNLMSFTGFKSLMVFTLLLEAPRTYAEVCDYFKNHPYIKEEISIDTFRVYITSLKRSGCEIVRSSSKEGSKYHIVSHPFELKISKEQIRGIAKVYKIIMQTIDVKGLFVFDKFIKSLAEKTKNEELLGAYNRMSVFRDINPKLMSELFGHAAAKHGITFTYKTPGNPALNIELVPDKIGISNGKVYVYGTDLNRKEYSYFLVSKIKEIVSVKLDNVGVEPIKPLKIKYELKSLTPSYKLNDEEKILEITEDTILVEMTTKNKFIAKQKILEYGALCKVLEPADFRAEIVDTLKRMREGYNHG